MRKIKIIAYLLGFAFLVYYSGAFIVEKINAAEVTGWLWGGGAEVNDNVPPWDNTNTNVGWVNANCASLVDSSDPDTIPDEPLKICRSGANIGKACNGPDAVACGVGVVCDSACGLSDYKVEVDNLTRNVSGYAWSENLGWIDFNPTGPYPVTGCGASGCPTYSVRKSADGFYFEGWARIDAIKDAVGVGNSGGWDGWVKMKGSDYGVEIAKMDGTGNNPTYAWSNELGWIDFSQTLLMTPSFVVCKASETVDAISLIVGATGKFEAFYRSNGAEITCSNKNAGDQNVTDSSEWDTDPNSVATIGNIIPDKGLVEALVKGNAFAIAEYEYAPGNSLSDTGFICVSDGSCKDGTCQGTTCDECGFPYVGTKDCGGGTEWQEAVN